MSLFMPYVFVVHSRLVLTRLPLAKAFLRAILTVNTYPFDWHLHREYVDISLNIASVRASLHRHEPPPLPTLPFVLHWCQPQRPPHRFRRSHKPPSLRVGCHLIVTSRSHRRASSLPTTSLRIGGPSAAASSRRFASLQSGHRP